MIDKSKIAILTTVASFNLYNKTATLFPEGIDKIVINGTNGMYGINSIHYMFKKLKNNKYEWIIMADEDIFFYDSNLVFKLIEYMQYNDIAVSGIREGGVIQHRLNNPEAINTFFSVINFKKIASKYNYKAILDCQKYIPALYQDKDYSHLKYSYDVQSLKEPYYCFYFWMHLNNFKFGYLNSINPVNEDYVGNIILMPDGTQLAYHSWYARAFEVYSEQTLRFQFFFKDFNIEHSTVDWNKVKILNDYFFNWKKRSHYSIKRLFRK